jgi:hypothetical protein
VREIFILSKMAFVTHMFLDDSLVFFKITKTKTEYLYRPQFSVTYEFRLFRVYFTIPLALLLCEVLRVTFFFHAYVYEMSIFLKCCHVTYMSSFICQLLT